MSSQRYLFSHSVIGQLRFFPLLMLFLPLGTFGLTSFNWWITFIFVILSVVIVHFGDRAYDLVRTMRTLRSVSRKVDKDAAEMPVFRDYQDYVGVDLGSAIDSGAINPFSDPLPIKTYLFQYAPKGKGVYMGTFALQIAPCICLIFTPYRPEDLNPARLNTLMHEVGHADTHSWFRSRTYLGANFAVFMLIVLSVHGPAFLVLSCLAWFCSFLFLRLYVSEMRFREELRADMVAVLLSLYARHSTHRDEKGLRAKSLCDAYWQRRRKKLPTDRTLTTLQNRMRQNVFMSFSDEATTGFGRAHQFAEVKVKRRRFLWSTPLVIGVMLIVFLGVTFSSPLSLREPALLLPILAGAALTLIAICFAAWLACVFALRRFATAFLDLDRREHELRELIDPERALEALERDGDIDIEKIANLYEATFPVNEMIYHFSDFGHRRRVYHAETMRMIQALKGAPEEAVEDLLRRIESPETQKVGDDFRKGVLGRKGV